MLSYTSNFKSKEFSLSYLELSESCTIAELMNLLAGEKNKNERDQILNGRSRLNKEQQAGVP